MLKVNDLDYGCSEHRSQTEESALFQYNYDKALLSFSDLSKFSDSLENPLVILEWNATVSWPGTTWALWSVRYSSAPGCVIMACSIFQLSPISTPINHNKPWSHEWAIIVLQRGQCHSRLVIPHSIRDLSAFNPRMHQDILATAHAPLVWMRLGSWRRAVSAAGGPIMAHPPRPVVARDQRSRSTRQQCRGCECVPEVCQRACWGKMLLAFPLLRKR